MFDRLKADIERIRAVDPAARGDAEIFLLYSGLHAVRSHRRANWLLRHNLPFLARALSQLSKFATGIEIHPAAKIGEGVFIDHGSGVVIGETAVVGDDCVIYQGATLGGTGKETGKRHPTLGKNVMVGCGARVLGPITIGDNVKIAANAVVLSDLPPNSTAVGVPARVVKRDGVRIQDDMVDQIHIPDPVSQELCLLRLKVAELERRLDARERGRDGNVQEAGGDIHETCGGEPKRTDNTRQQERQTDA